MTAEIGVLNRYGVALAADSAVTIGSGDRNEKVFQHANKMFQLSLREPVAVMVYANADLAGMPWETIIKRYRSIHGHARFDHLEDYAHHFLRELGACALEYFSGERIDALAKDRVKSCIRLAAGHLRDVVEETLSRQAEISGEELAALSERVIGGFCDDAERGLALSPGITPESADEIFSTMEAFATQAVGEALEEAPVSHGLRQRLGMVARRLVTHTTQGLNEQNMTGLVFAGFGWKDMYPRLISFDVSGIVRGGVRYRERVHHQISERMTGAIAPFAQSDVVLAFVHGVDPGLRRAIHGLTDTLFPDYVDHLIDVLGDMPDAVADRLRAQVRADAPGIRARFQEWLGEVLDTNAVQPLLGVVAVLPKEELAHMAETLVSLTAFRRRLTMSAETVGGPIDVAVVTKADGFIWMRRKHYFDPGLNPQFFVARNLTSGSE